MQSLHHCALHCKRTLDTTNEKFSIQCFALFLSPFTDHTLQANPHASCFHEFILILGFHKCLVFTKIFHIGSVTAPLCTPLQEDPRHDKWEILDSMLRSLPFSLHKSYVAGKSPHKLFSWIYFNFRFSIKVSFLGELKTLKFPFEIKWPLVFSWSRSFLYWQSAKILQSLNIQPLVY